MRALHISTRLAGTDGVSLESAKLAATLEELGFERWDCAGETRFERAVTIPELHFRDPVAEELGARAFGGAGPDRQLDADLAERPQLVCLSKVDCVDADTAEAQFAELQEAAGRRILALSSLRGDGVKHIVRAMHKWLQQQPREPDDTSSPD